LVDNAIKFSARDTEILVSLEKREGEVRVSVSDHGPGISVEDQRKLFTPFFQASSTSSVNVKGSGLGLVISKGILEAHKGRIWCESVLGEGTTFSFALPFRQDG
ncbi:MAG TPA: ATP-binding protein, partial [Candidatus Diapherotrites archaeon]|nr:ATP-binding protein [Candidatus Diapherotrites archaeon]